MHDVKQTSKLLKEHQKIRSYSTKEQPECMSHCICIIQYILNSIELFIFIIVVQSRKYGEDGDNAMGHGMRPSKSDTSLTDSFVIIDSKKKLQSILRDGFKWERQLVFRSKLTMHTAYDRKDNAEPASITALASSKDHRTLYVGK